MTARSRATPLWHASGKVLFPPRLFDTCSNACLARARRALPDANLPFACDIPGNLVLVPLWLAWSIDIASDLVLGLPPSFDIQTGERLLTKAPPRACLTPARTATIIALVGRAVAAHGIPAFETTHALGGANGLLALVGPHLRRAVNAR